MNGKTMGQILQEIRSSHTFYLRKNVPKFFDGVASAVDICGNTVSENYHTSESDSVADSRAIASDWKAVGADMYSAIEKHGR